MVLAMVAFTLLPSILSFTLHSKVSLSKVRAPVRTPSPVAYQEDESFTAIIDRLEQNVIRAESDWDSALSDARMWLEAPSGLSRVAPSSLDSLLQLPVGSSSVSMTENEDSYTVTVAGLLGVDAIDVDVAVDDHGVLQIEGETTVRTSGGLSRSSLRRSLPVPGDADSDVMSVTREDDALIVVLPKTGEAPSVDDELVSGAEERAATKSPHFARWLKAHGYHSTEQKELEEEVDVAAE